jgi:hypothetical protein
MEYQFSPSVEDDISKDFPRQLEYNGNKTKNKDVEKGESESSFENSGLNASKPKSDLHFGLQYEEMVIFLKRG